MTNHLFTALSEGRCIAKHHDGGWLYVWTEETSTGYTRWRRRGWGSGLGTVDELIMEIHHRPELWVIL